MTKIILESWSAGLEKVSLIKLQVCMLGTSLKALKCNVDALLNARKVIIEIDDIDLVHAFLKEAEKIGGNCKLLLDQ